MGIIETVSLAAAAESGTAIRRRHFRHVHLTEDPILLATVSIPNEAVGILAIGAKRIGEDRPRLWVNPEPRNPIIRDNRLQSFMAWIGEEANDAFQGGSAPQLLIPSAADIHELTVLSRIYRYQRRDRQPLPPEVIRGSQYLHWITERAHVPGSAVLLPATRELTRIWMPGLSSIETTHLGALVAAIDPPRGTSVAAAVRAAEAVEFGPINDNNRLFPAVMAFNKARSGSVDPAVVDSHSGPVEDVAAEFVHARLEALEHAFGLLRTVDEAPSAPIRWNGPPPSGNGSAFDWGYAADVPQFSYWAGRVAADEARVAVRTPRALQARQIAAWEAAAQVAEAAEAFEDPLAMVSLIADGHAWKGVVAHHDLGQGNRIRPTLTVGHQQLACPFAPNTVLRWAGDPRRIRMRIVRVHPLRTGGSSVELEVQNPVNWRNMVAATGCPNEVVVADLNPDPAPMPPQVAQGAWN